MDARGGDGNLRGIEKLGGIGGIDDVKKYRLGDTGNEVAHVFEPCERWERGAEGSPGRSDRGYFVAA